MDIVMKILLPINIIVVLFNCAVYLKDWKKGIFLYFILSYVWPLTRIANTAISYEILGFVFLFPAILGRLISLRNFVLKKSIIIFEMFSAAMILSTIVSAIRHNTSINYILLFAYFRFNVLLLLLLQEDMITNRLKDFFGILVPINFIACLIQVYVPNSYVFFCNLYTKREDAIALILRNNGIYTRLYGTFSISTQLAVFSLLATSFYAIRFLFRNNDLKTLSYLTMSIIMGIGSACKSFFLGSTMLAAYLIIGILIIASINKIKKRRIYFLKKLSMKKNLQIIVALSLIILCTKSFSNTVAIEYYFKASFSNFEHSMEVRFSGLRQADNGAGNNSFIAKINKNINEEEMQSVRCTRQQTLKQGIIAAMHINAIGNIKEMISKLVFEAEKEGMVIQAAALGQKAKVTVPQGTTVGMTASLDRMERLIGVGATTPYNEFVGDSEWIMFYHYAGIIGIALIGIWLFDLIAKALKRLQVDSIIYIALVILGATGLSMISSLMGTMIIAYVITNINSDEWRNRLVVAHDSCQQEGSYGDCMRRRVKFRVRRRQEVADCEF